MKARIFLLIITMVFSLSGCKKYKTTAIINEDGSIDRTVSVNTNKESVPGLSFYVPFDSSWVITVNDSGRGSEGVIYTAKKHFDSVIDLINEYLEKGKIEVEINLSKKERWFYTYYEYEEIYKAYSPFKKLSLKEYLTEKEYVDYLAGSTSDTLSGKLEKFMMKNIVQDFIEYLITKTDQLNDPMLTGEKILQKSNELTDSLIQIDGTPGEVLKHLEKIFDTKAVYKLEDDVKSKIKEYEQKFEFIQSAEGEYTHEIVMPGLILSTNANELEGSTARWTVNSERFLYADYPMVVESRVANVWAMWVTGVVVFVIILLLVVPKLRR